MARGQEERERYENPKKRVEGILFDTEDPTTRLIGERAVTARREAVRDAGETFYEQLWRTSDAHYFVYSGLEPTPLDVKAAHAYMNAVWACRKFLTDEEQREVALDDEKRHEGRF